MPNITKEAVIPSLIPNTTMFKGIVDGVHKQYEITANDGYVLHDNRADLEADGVITLEPTELFATGTISVRYDYDFANTTQGTYNGTPVTKYGAYELYAIAEDTEEPEQAEKE